MQETAARSGALVSFQTAVRHQPKARSTLHYPWEYMHAKWVSYIRAQRALGVKQVNGWQRLALPK